jgi:5'-methylthioadenosine phosphorylase
MCIRDSVLFLPRHGREHSVAPSGINYRAQIAALKKLNADWVVGVCAVGSLMPELPGGSFAVLSDFIDLTKRRPDTFFGETSGPVVHTDFTEPYCPVVSRELVRACSTIGVTFQPSGVYVGVEGPRYESPAEIRLYASWGGHVVGMTNLPEVVLAREAGLCYGALAVVTNLASGLSPTRLTHDEVRAAMALASENTRAIVMDVIAALPEAGNCACRGNDRLAI